MSLRPVIFQRLRSHGGTQYGHSYIFLVRQPHGYSSGSWECRFDEDGLSASAQPQSSIRSCAVLLCSSARFPRQVPCHASLDQVRPVGIHRRTGETATILYLAGFRSEARNKAGRNSARKILADYFPAAGPILVFVA